MAPTKHFLQSKLTSILYRGPSAILEIADKLQISTRSVLRIINGMNDSVCHAGKARRRKYALKHKIRGIEKDTPVYAIDKNGSISNIGFFNLVEPSGSLYDISEFYPVDSESRDGWWQGLPYPIYDMQPQGFIGKYFARQVYESLKISQNPIEWSDEDIVFVLSRKFHDITGNMILGDQSIRLFQEELLQPLPSIPESETVASYIKLADHTNSFGFAGSSVAGEFPKFTALREYHGSNTPHVIVKFSGKADSETSQRWSDLLISEYYALQVAGTLPGIKASKCRILNGGGRTFFESERFDRHGRFGRSPLVTLGSISGHLVDTSLLDQKVSDWRSQATALHRLKLLSSVEANNINILWWFGHLIANTDMHLGNLSFFPFPNKLSMAPVYDILPMAYAPLAGGELPSIDIYNYKLPIPSEKNNWIEASMKAILFWQNVSTDLRISRDFRAISTNNCNEIKRIQDRLSKIQYQN